MKKTVTLNDKTFEVMIPAHEIDRAVAAVAERLNADYGDKERPIFVGVLIVQVIQIIGNIIAKKTEK